MYIIYVYIYILYLHIYIYIYINKLLVYIYIYTALIFCTHARTPTHIQTSISTSLLYRSLTY